MNGSDLLQSMGFVDEAYILEAEEVPQRRQSHWKVIALSAACLALVLLGLWRLVPQQEQQPMVSAAVYQAGGVNETNAATAERNDAGPRMASAVAEMTVLVIERREDTLLCQVIDPGTGPYRLQEQVELAVPQSAASAQEAAKEKTSAQERYLVRFLPEQDAIITPLELTLLPEE